MVKLPRPKTRRYRILAALYGREIGVDELISAFGLFGLEWRSGLITEMQTLKACGYVEGDWTAYRLTKAAERLMAEAGEEPAQLVQPRRYNVFERPPLKKEHMVSREPRRPNCPETRPERFLIASQPIPVQNDE